MPFPHSFISVFVVIIRRFILFRIQFLHIHFIPDMVDATKSALSLKTIVLASTNGASTKKDLFLPLFPFSFPRVFYFLEQAE